MEATQYLVYGFPTVAVVIALVKVARETGLPSKFAQASSLRMGIVTRLVMAYQNGDPWLAGVVAGKWLELAHVDYMTLEKRLFK